MMYDVLVVGAGQAGLATGYYLKEAGVNYLMIDAGSSIGDSWRNRYDSLQLFTPREYDALPGMQLRGHKNTLPSKNEIADYLEDYAAFFKLPVVLNVLARRLWKKDGIFCLETTKGLFEARSIVIATGPFHRANIPDFSKQLPENVIQFHSSEYKNPLQLSPGSTLVVGGGNSGAQIAAEIALHAKQSVAISISGTIKYKPLYIMKRSIFWYFEKLGILRAGADTLRGAWLRKQPEYVYGYDLKKLVHKGKVRVYPRTLHVEGQRVIFEDRNELVVDNVIWATGFKQNYASWMDIEGALNSNGEAVHNEGVSPIDGLYFVGLPWQTARGSALIGWVKYDAERIVSHIKKSTS
ncbi:NAD(P)/FAD-dependent oxidoreductase [Paenibacillus sp. JJ-223]|uniref:flavin-containing monooxygenase n=1 Tax=Paenibacillus sp. JJ-223 TaxID=2905647 RepID=UPI001F1CDBD1|nr:NAD(P)/FAD-dependent oxidoreductase [Paenibacillus sp. JJ-223]